MSASSSHRRRVQRSKTPAEPVAPQVQPPIQWNRRMIAPALLLLVAMSLLMWKFDAASSASSRSLQSSNASALPAFSVPELASSSQPLFTPPDQAKPTTANGSWKRADQLQKGDVVTLPDGRRLVIKDTNSANGTLDELPAPAASTTLPPCQETHLELDLSQGGDTFDETLIVPADQQAILVNGTSKPAQQLTMGDRVLMSGDHIAVVKKAESKMYTPPAAQEPDANGNTASRVVGTTKRMASKLLYLYTADELVKTTPEHPFSVRGKGWVQAGRLQYGDQVETQSGKLIAVDHVEVRPERQMVYNLEVEGTHNFYVGKDGLLVHNGGDCVPELLKSIESLEKRAAEHEAKLADYIRNPDAFDNQGFLKNAPSDAIRQRIIDGRVRHLNKEIETFRQNIGRLRGQLPK